MGAGEGHPLLTRLWDNQEGRGDSGEQITVQAFHLQPSVISGREILNPLSVLD